jgi:hypothetical protein
MHTYIYIHTHAHTYIYTYIHIHTHTHTHTGDLGGIFGIFYMDLGDIFIWAKQIVSPEISKSFNNNLRMCNYIHNKHLLMKANITRFDF